MVSVVPLKKVSQSIQIQSKMDKIEIVSQTENKKEEILNPFYSSSTLNLIQTTPLMKNDNIESNTEEESKEFAHFDDFSEEIQLRVLPLIPREQLFERDFSLRQPTNIEVTSVDVASHGCFVICGCSNGQILLFDLSQPNPSTSMAKSTTSVAFQQPQLIGHIKAKGIHTNLLLTVVITEDCRFCFAGVLKGSSELLAIDVMNYNKILMHILKRYLLSITVAWATTSGSYPPWT
jgi:hypothetical protein